jgi:hypothetical protein
MPSHARALACPQHSDFSFFAFSINLLDLGLPCFIEQLRQEPAPFYQDISLTLTDRGHPSQDPSPLQRSCGQQAQDGRRRQRRCHGW